MQYRSARRQLPLAGEYHPQRTALSVPEKDLYEILAARRRRQPGSDCDPDRIASRRRADPRHRGFGSPERGHPDGERGPLLGRQFLGQRQHAGRRRREPVQRRLARQRHPLRAQHGGGRRRGPRRPDGQQLHPVREPVRLRGVGQRQRFGRHELRVRRHGRRPLRLPDARRVHRRLGRQRDRLVRAGQPAEPPHHLRRERRGGLDGAGVHPDQLRLLLHEHLGQRRDVLHAVAVQHGRRTSSSSPPSSAGSTPSSASRTSSRTC